MAEQKEEEVKRTLRNKVTLIGRLGAEPEFIKFDSGRMLARFSLATVEDYRNKEGEWESHTQWHNVTAWGKVAELISNMLHRGSEVIVEGKLVNNSYETKDGEKRYGTTVEVREFLLITGNTNE